MNKTAFEQAIADAKERQLSGDKKSEALQVVVEKTELELTMDDYFKPFDDQFKEWSDKAKLIVVTSADQTELMAEARKARLALRDIRLEVKKTHDELKADTLQRGRIIDGASNRLTKGISDVEKLLQDQEDFIKIQEQNKRDELYKSRSEKLKQYIGATWPDLSVVDMTEEQFGFMVVVTRLQLKRRQKKKSPTGWRM